LACVGREGLVGMIGVDKIGQIRRAFFERHLPIKEIVRTLSVSRATVRKVIRGNGLHQFLGHCKPAERHQHRL
jgi:DNA invertase Pin-like site-specific DNA recombinase